MLKKIKKKLVNKSLIPYYILIIITLLIGLPLLNTKMLNGHDAVFHLFRIDSTLKAIQDHQLIPMINPNMFEGLGYAPNMFYGTLTTYIVQLINIFTPTLGLAINLFNLLTIFTSGLFMYNFIKDMKKNQTIALLAAIFYMINPYFLHDIYVRAAIGEIASFAFIPLVFHGLYNIINGNQKKWYLLTIGASALVLTHNLSAFTTAIFAMIYLLLNIKKVLNKKTITTLAKALIITLFISAATILPLIEAKLSSNYMVFDKNYMHTTGKYMAKRTINPLTPLKDNLNSISLFYTIALLIIIYIQKKKTKINNQSTILAIITLILTLPIIPWAKLPDILSIIQFPWRYLQYTSFFCSIAFAITLIKIFPKFQTKHLIYPIITLIIITNPTIIYGFTNPKINNNLIYSNQIKLKKDTVRSTGSASSEYLPKNAIYNYEYLKNHKKEPIAIQGNAQIINSQKKGTNLTFTTNTTNDTIIELPYFYYPGYQVMANKEKIKTFETKNGLLGIELHQGNYQVNVKYQGTTTMILAYIISLTSIIILTIYIKSHQKKPND